MIEKLNELPSVSAELTEKLNCNVAVLIDACRPLPVACTPLMRATMSVPASRVEALPPLFCVANVPLMALSAHKRIGAVFGRLQLQAGAGDRGFDTRGIGHLVQSGGNLSDGGAGTEVEHLEAVLAADLQHQVAGECAAGVSQFGLAWPACRYSLARRSNWPYRSWPGRFAGR